MKKRLLASLLSLCLIVGLLSTAALAADAHWAADAVNKLNEIYGSNTFTASDDVMDLSEAATVLKAMGCESEKLPDPNNGGSATFTRSVACEVLAEVFSLPVPSGKTAIQYLYDKNIINGYADGSLGENDSITKAQFAVITYRVLNSIGGGDGSSIEGLKPGTNEYFSWIYLMTKGCIENDSPTEKIDETTWSRWRSKLNLSDESTGEGDEGGTEGSTVDTSLTKAQAAVKLVIEELNITQIFSDVMPNSPYYDGVMYLFDRGIVMGYADGSFGVNDILTYQQLALLFCRMADDYQAPGQGEEIYTPAQQYVIDKGYMTEPVDWAGSVTREDAIVAIVKQQGVNVDSVNTAILDRFSDGANVAEAKKPYIAYAVSIGLVNGTADGNLALSETTTRGMFGILLYRTLIGVDTTKMKDYEENIGYVLGDGQ